MDKSKLTKDSLDAFKRVNYFDRQFLTVDEFKDEQQYNIKKRELHNAYVHSNGVVKNFELIKGEINDNLLSVQIGNGLALDRCGKELYIAADNYIEAQYQITGVNDFPLSVYLSYNEENANPYLYGVNDDSTEMTRKAEVPILKLLKSSQAPTESDILIGTLEKNSETSVAMNYYSVTGVNAVLHEAVVDSLTIRDYADKIYWPKIFSGQGNSISFANTNLINIGLDNRYAVFKFEEDKMSFGVDHKGALGTYGDNQIKPVIQWNDKGNVGINSEPLETDNDSYHQVKIGSREGASLVFECDNASVPTAFLDYSKDDNLRLKVSETEINLSPVGDFKITGKDAKFESVNGNINIEGKSTAVKNDLSVGGDLSVKGNIKISGDVYVDGKLDAKCLTHKYVYSADQKLEIGDVVVFGEVTSSGRLENINDGFSLDKYIETFKGKNEVIDHAVFEKAEKLLNAVHVTTTETVMDNRVCGVVVKKSTLLKEIPSKKISPEVYVAYSGMAALCKVETSKDEIKPGDLLVTSNIKGYAMRMNDTVRKSGTQGVILGKALYAVPKGKQCAIPVLLMLQ